MSVHQKKEKNIEYIEAQEILLKGGNKMVDSKGGFGFGNTGTLFLIILILIIFSGGFFGNNTY